MSSTSKRQLGGTQFEGGGYRSTPRTIAVLLFSSSNPSGEVDYQKGPTIRVSIGHVTRKQVNNVLPGALWEVKHT